MELLPWTIAAFDDFYPSSETLGALGSTFLVLLSLLRFCYDYSSDFLLAYSFGSKAFGEVMEPNGKAIFPLPWDIDNMTTALNATEGMCVDQEIDRSSYTWAFAFTILLLGLPMVFSVIIMFKEDPFDLRHPYTYTPLKNRSPLAINTYVESKLKRAFNVMLFVTTCALGPFIAPLLFGNGARWGVGSQKVGQRFILTGRCHHHYFNPIHGKATS